ncbi:MAG: competence/damage-inducible protein A [Gemmatimonadales bacterium]
MDVELVTIGTELLLGFTTDTNGAFAGQRLAEIGVRVARRTAVGDQAEAIRDAVAGALERSGLVIVTGGLGPTRDDITKRTVAELFEAPLEFQQPLWDALVERFARFGRVPAESNRCQAEVPRGATVLPNRRGTAPGIWLSGPRGEVVMLPGVPKEMRGLMVDEVIPRLRARRAGGSAVGVIVSRTVRTTSIPESSLGERIAPLEPAIAPLTVAYLPGLEGVDLRITAWDLPEADAASRLEAAVALIREEVADHGYGTDDVDLARVLIDRLRERGLTLAVAESCTGGAVGERITAVPGSSDVFLGGVIAYANAIKLAELAVPEATIAEHGAVSEAVSLAMVTGLVAKTGAGAAVSITGIAGPAGGSSEKPVGTVWFGFHVAGRVDAQRVVFPGSREEVRARAAQFALHGVWRRLRPPR